MLSGKVCLNVKGPDLNLVFRQRGELACVELIDRNERAISFRSLPMQAFFGNRFPTHRSSPWLICDSFHGL